MTTLTDVQNELAEIEAKKDVLLQRKRELLYNHPLRQLAILIHEKECRWNHTDGCSWGYEQDGGTHNWNGNAHKRALENAEKLVDKAFEQGLSLTDLLALYMLLNNKTNAPNEAPEGHEAAYVIERRAGSWTDPWGQQQKVDVLKETLYLKELDETHEYNNGYEDMTARVAQSQEGERFYRRVPTDYAGQSVWISLTDPKRHAETRLSQPLVDPQGLPVKKPQKGKVTS